MTQAWHPTDLGAPQHGVHPVTGQPLAPGYAPAYPAAQAWVPQFPPTAQPVHAQPVPGMPGTPSAASPAPAWSELDAAGAAPVQLAAQEHQRNMMAAVITLIAVVIGLWGALGYLHSTVKILGGISTSSNQILVKMQTSQEGLEALQAKTSKAQPMAVDTAQLETELHGMDGSMTSMLANVNAISHAVGSMNQSVGTLDGTLSEVNATNGELGGSLKSINAGLGQQAQAVGGMKTDVVASSTGLGTIPPKLTATEDRLRAIDADLCVLGQKGVAAPTGIRVGFLGINTGSATIHATLIPIGSVDLLSAIAHGSMAAPYGTQRQPQSLSGRLDTWALTIGSKLSVSALLLGAVLVLVLGAESMKTALGRMNTDLATMSHLLDTTNSGLDTLNQSLASLPRTRATIGDLTTTAAITARQVSTSSRSLGGMSRSTTSLASSLAAITGSSKQMQVSLSSVNRSTGQLQTATGMLAGSVGPLAASQHDLATQVGVMGTGVSGLNGSLAYTIRVMNYLTAPPGGGSFTVSATLDKKFLPPLPGIKATVTPITVFSRNIWPVYTGP